MSARPTSGGAGARLLLGATHSAAALALCAVLCLMSAVWPPSRVALVGVWYGAAAVLALLAGGVLLVRHRPRASLVALVVAGQAAALLGGYRTVRRALALVLVTLAAGMLASPVPFHPLSWLVLAATTVAMSSLVTYLVTRLRVIATTDDLTGALGRTAFEEEVGRVVRDAARHGRPASVVCLDVDDFKRVNDTRGHQAGDTVLVSLVAGWRAGLDRHDAIGRLGGDEFVVVLAGRDAAAAEDWVRDAGERRRADDPTWSHGTAQAHGDEPVRDLLARADAAMYARKRQRA